MPYKELDCDGCGKNFNRRITTQNIGNKRHFCSRQCCAQHLDNSIIQPCAYCGNIVEKQFSQYKKSISGNTFCGRSCAGFYNNAHKTKGRSVSKLEKYLAKQLIYLYPDIQFIFNSNQAIDSELDIYLPTYKLAFELNGIFHYEPIFGPDKLARIQNNDDRKFQACLERGIELVMIDTTSQKYFKEKTSKKFLDIITNIIDRKLI